MPTTDPKEERANVWTHVPGIVATLLLAWPLASHAAAVSSTCLLGVVLFLFGMLVMFTNSTVYHYVKPGPLKRKLRVLDHCSIYVMIAGCYSLISIEVLGGWMGWSLFVFMWLCVVAGIIGKTIALGKHPKVSLALYLVMGWMAVLVMWPLWKALPHFAFWCIIAEGVFYSIGSWFFAKDDDHRYFHAIWHVFILLGAASHTLATWWIIAQAI